MKNDSVWLMVMLIVVSLASCGESIRKISPAEPMSDGFKEVTENGMTLKWKVDGANLKVVVKAPTTGWVAVGFQPSSMMKDANIIIGYVKGNQLFIRNDYGTGNTVHESSLKENILEKSGKEADGYTEISFTIPLNSGDSKLKALVPGNECDVILGYGPNDADNFKAFHKNEVRIKITL
jgi:hypothetical protein